MKKFYFVVRRVKGENAFLAYLDQCYETLIVYENKSDAIKEANSFSHGLLPGEVFEIEGIDK